MAEGTAPAELLPAGTLLHRRYALGGVLARGTYGVTYEATDTKFNRPVALKEYFPGGLAFRARDGLSLSPKNKACGALFFLGSEMFYRQHLALTDAKGSCNVVTVFNAFFENGTSYAVMERLEGVTLEGYLRLRRRRLTPEEGMFVAASMADALLVVHSLNSLHYDINAQSVFICTDGSVKLIDFGAAKAGLRARHEVDDAEPWLDLGALGKALYEAMSGRRAPDGEIVPDPNIPAPFYELLLRMLAQDGAPRFASVFDYRHALACLDVGAVCPAVTGEEAAAFRRDQAGRRIMSAPQSRQEQPQEAAPQQKRKGILDRALDSLQEAVEFDPSDIAPEHEERRKHLTRRAAIFYAAVVVVTLTVALIIRALTH
ncbi:MAG TPA: protein kinase [Eubacteriales bacterium]|nr:protein kinase [Eubacteriales bacterium]